ncbi:hypothetical protein KBC97_02640 [Candidatus Gracilibacteria bacterium]|nr:hypothetical protein [Candidatus Gracilibacteria bacterium]
MTTGNNTIAILKAKIDNIDNETQIIQKILRLCEKTKEEDSNKEDTNTIENLLQQLEKN